VYDVGDMTSFAAVPSFVADAKRYSPAETKVYVCGNKIDHIAGISAEAADQMCASLGVCVPSHFTSAKTGEGIDAMFDRIAADLLEGVVRKLFCMTGNGSTIDKSKLTGASIDGILGDKKPKSCGDSCVIL
jgi:hypothetical protein